MFPFRIHKFTHFFTVALQDLRHQRLIYEFTHNFTDVQQEYNPQTRSYHNKLRVWGGRIADNSSFRFPIAVLDKFVKFLEARNVSKFDITYDVEPLYLPAPAEFTLNEEYKPRQHQIEALQYTLEQRAQGAPSVLITMPPGTGKTVTYAFLLTLMKLRAGLIIPATYIEKWQGDIAELLGLTKDDFYLIKGGPAIQKAMKLVREDRFDYKFVLISLPTFSEFLKNYETSPKQTIDKYGVDPITFWAALRIGVLGGDEVHEMFHAFFRMHTTLHGPFHLGLSATMLDSQPFIEEMQRCIYPKNIRFDKIKMKKYMDMINIDYRFENFDRDRIKTTYPRNSSYSQNAYEDSIYRNKKVLANFMKMVKWAVDTFFLHSGYVPGDKVGLYFASKQMIYYVVDYLKKQYPHLDIRPFVQNEPYINLIVPDIRCTTQGSGGTGKDIKALTTVLNFNTINQLKANIQLAGRLREIEGRDLFFVQFNCGNIKKHQQYKHERNEGMKDQVKSISQKFYGDPL